MKSAEQRRILNTWLDRHRGLIFKVVRSNTRNHQDSEDLFQEIAIQLWQSIPGFQGACAETTWIYRVAFFAASRWIRSEGRRPKTIYGYNSEAFEKSVIEKNEKLRLGISLSELFLASLFAFTGILTISEPILEDKDHHQYFTGSLYLLVSIAIGIHWRRRQSLPSFDQSLLQIVDGMIAQVESHIRFLNWSWLWLGLPYAIVVGLGYTIQGAGKPGWLWLLALVGLPLSMWITLRTVPRIHRPQVEELQALRKTLAEADESQATSS